MLCASRIFVRCPDAQLKKKYPTVVSESELSHVNRVVVGKVK